MSRILLVDDDFTIKLELEEMLTAIGYDIVGTAENGEQAFEMAKALNPDLILMDIVMPGDMDGISAAEKIRRESDIPIVFITGYGEPEYVERAKMVEPFGYVMKPFDEKEISAVVEIALYKRDMELKLKKAHDRLERSNRDFKEEIAERKKADEALRQSKKNLDDLIQGVQAGVVVHGSDMKIEVFNTAALNILGLNRDQILGRQAADPCWRFVHEDGRPMNFEEYPVNIVSKSRKPLTDYCLGVIRPDRNEPLWILVNAVPQFKENGEIDQIIVTSVDISKRIQSENRYRNLFTATNDGVCLHEIIYRDDKPVDYRILDINPRYESIIGIKRADAVGALGSELYGSGEPPYLDIFTDIAETGKPGSFETYFEPMDKYFLISVFSPGPHKFATVFQDITERKRAEEALRTSEAQLSNAMHIAQLGYWEYDVANDLFIFNDHFYAIFRTSAEQVGGYQMSSARYAQLFVHPEDMPVVGLETQKAIESTDPKYSRQIEHRIIYADGEIGYISVRFFIVKDSQGRTVKTYGANQDITERKRAEEENARLQSQLQQSQKMEAIGTLAGGIAHDFNNILAIILGNAELAADDIPVSNPASESLKEIRKASIRAKDMVRQLLAFSRKADEKNRPLDMAPIIKESMKMLRSAVPTSVEFKQHISDDPCHIQGDVAQINQIVMNLVINAADAMSEEGGLLEVTLEKIILQEEKVCFDWVLSPGPYVRLRMRDTGEGIEPEIMKRIFDPYYTTKEIGKGTGMGLSVVHGIVKRHGGGILVESELGKGTVFEIYFPALEEAAEEGKEPDGEIRGGSERILFVDDEEPMVNLNRQRLERLGYQVRSTTKPVEALEWFKADPDQFDVIITDMTMPRMTGDRLTAEVLKIRPHMPVIICTGYSERMSAKKAEALGVRKYIEKPIELRKLASSLREVLDEK